MFNFIRKMIGAANKYTAWDYFCLKTTVFSLGILMGAYFPDFFMNYTLLLWTIFLITYVYIIYRTFFKLMK